MANQTLGAVRLGEVGLAAGGLKKKTLTNTFRVSFVFRNCYMEHLKNNNNTWGGGLSKHRYHENMPMPNPRTFTPRSFNLEQMKKGMYQKMAEKKDSPFTPISPLWIFLQQLVSDCLHVMSSKNESNSLKNVAGLNFTPSPFPLISR